MCELTRGHHFGHVNRTIFDPKINIDRIIWIIKRECCITGGSNTFHSMLRVKIHSQNQYHMLVTYYYVNYASICECDRWDQVFQSHRMHLCKCQLFCCIHFESINFSIQYIVIVYSPVQYLIAQCDAQILKMAFVHTFDKLVLKRKSFETVISNNLMPSTAF